MNAIECLSLMQMDLVNIHSTEECMIEFAKLKVKEAIDAIVNNINNEIEKDFITEGFIRDSYNINKIK